MKKSNRILISLVTVEALLFGLGAWLMSGISSGSLSTTGSPAEAASTILSTLGSVMGVVGAVMAVVWFSLRRKGL